jgi:nitrogenase molybdenum-iron protein beta chain
VVDERKSNKKGVMIMNNIIFQPRNFCELGALHSVLAINGAVPIVHSGAACCLRLYQGMSYCNGYQGFGDNGGSFIPNDNIHREDFIYGGEYRIRELIHNTVKLVDGELYVVFTGCNVQLSGDDVKAVVSEFKKKGIPVVYVDTAGYKGNAYIGHELVMKSIAEQFVTKNLPVKKGQVNFWISPPYLDPFWSGNIDTLKDMLEQIGFHVNTLFGFSSNVNSWIEVPTAEFNILISPWVGIKTMEFLKEQFGTPFIQYPSLPIGAYESGKFLRCIGEFCNIDMDMLDKYVEKKESKFYYYMERLTELLTRYDSSFPQRFFIIGESSYVLGITSFLINELGMIPGCQHIVDNPPNIYKENIKNKIESSVYFSDDSQEIIKNIKDECKDFIPLIIGSSWDKKISDELNGYFLCLSTPVSDKVILDKSYLGYEGGLNFIEDIFSCILNKL